LILVIDASALITLARIGRLNLLRGLAEQIYIPEAVYSEVVRRSGDRPGGREVTEASWIIRKSVLDQTTLARLRTELGRGEAEAIVLTGELRADFVVLDDAKARRLAETEGKKTIGLLGLLLRAKERGIVSDLKPIVDDMIKVGFFIDQGLYQAILRQSGEEPAS